MKKTILFVSATAALLAAGVLPIQAHYYHDKAGWYDEHNHHHSFISYNHHRGYWDTNNGVRVFINVD